MRPTALRERERFPSYSHSYLLVSEYVQRFIGVSIEKWKKHFVNIQVGNFHRERNDARVPGMLIYRPARIFL